MLKVRITHKEFKEVVRTATSTTEAPSRQSSHLFLSPHSHFFRYRNLASGTQTGKETDAKTRSPDRAALKFTRGGRGQGATPTACSRSNADKVAVSFFFLLLLLLLLLLLFFFCLCFVRRVLVPPLHDPPGSNVRTARRRRVSGRAWRIACAREAIGAGGSSGERDAALRWRKRRGLSLFFIHFRWWT
ncbi:hypothetical protein NL676_032416 [Syzygium grande]|nr:hypothetical protein NL676_032416 [Syzygium grande]